MGCEIVTSLRITAFGGLLPEVAARKLPAIQAQVAHNCLLWNGTLRPQAEWHLTNVPAEVDAVSIAYVSTIKQVVSSTELLQMIYLTGEPFPSITLGIKTGELYYVDDGVYGPTKNLTLDRPVVTGSITYEAGGVSKKPVHRMYAISYVMEVAAAKYESRLSLIPGQNPSAVIYEGDIAVIVCSVTSPPAGVTAVRVYRTISGLDTGEDVANNLDTEWHLVHEYDISVFAGSVTLREGGSITQSPLDVFLAKDFFPLDMVPAHLGQLESGWVVAASAHDVAVSERYMPAAWPSENYYRIPEQITDIVCHYDNVYIGTTRAPYIGSFAQGDKAPVQGAINPYPEDYACIPNTMVRTDFGAMYASSAGLVSLAKSGMRLLTGNIAAGSDVIYSTVVADTVTQEPLFSIDVTLQATTFGAYFQGTYYGFSGVVRNVIVPGLSADQLFPGVWYLYEVKGEINDPHALQQLVTLDTPHGYIPVYSCTAPSGLYILMESKTATADEDKRNVYVLPNPNTQLGAGVRSYNQSDKMMYRWKSKKFVMPGITVMSAMKVVHDCDGCLRIKIYVDCVCRYETVVKNCRPFRVPAHLAGVEWEVELIGNATIHEVHLATSMRELLEHER